MKAIALNDIGSLYELERRDESDESFRNWLKKIKVTHWLKETTIPNIAELLKEIDGLKAVRNTLGDMNNRVMEDLRTANQEIQRLKEVIKIAWWRGISEDYANDRLIKHWQQFKTENQL